ncbi:hypothetical protein [Williamsia sp.]|uniref:hypothetical protein n=1 Tax=Williamsia sp. TaxID=1872085 RepID=UPI002F941323
MTLSCSLCGRTMAMPHITDHTLAVQTGSTSGWEFQLDVATCPACATALGAIKTDATAMTV